MVSYGSLSFYLQNAPKSPFSSKSLKNLKKILKTLQNNYNVFKNTYIPWQIVGKIHGISTPQIYSFACPQAKQQVVSLEAV